MKTFQPVGAALPPRRDALVMAAATERGPTRQDLSAYLSVPVARDRMAEYFKRDPLPAEVKAALDTSNSGDLVFQHLLFNAMLDTWPKLQKGIAEIERKVSCAPWRVLPAAERGEKPTPEAEQMAKEVEAMVWGMKPNPVVPEFSIEGTIRGLVRGYYYGHAVHEIRWDRRHDGGWKPRATIAVDAARYGYPYTAPDSTDPEDRLMFNPNGTLGARNYVDFEPNRFLIAVHSGHASHPTMAAPLRALTGYWLAAVYGLKWFLNFTQLYGIPWRHAEVADAKDEWGVKNALSTIGSNGYIVTKPGTKINILGTSTSGDGLPQKALIDLADEQCDKFILGQTLTSGTDSSGSRALGEIHQGTLDDVVAGVADFVGGILTHQFIPALVSVNYGPRESMPEMWARPEAEIDEKAAAERMAIVSKIGIPVPAAWAYETLGIPRPADGEEVIFSQGGAAIPPGEPDTAPPAPTVAAADSAEAARLAEKMQAAMDKLTDGPGLMSEDDVAALLAAAWIKGAKDSEQ